VTAAALLDELGTAGVRLSLSGDDLHYRTRPGVSVAPFRDQITAHKPTLLTLLALQDEIVAAASAAQSAFDRAAYDQIWAEWHMLAEQEMP
jgi:hypothetical protein